MNNMHSSKNIGLTSHVTAPKNISIDHQSIEVYTTLMNTRFIICTDAISTQYHLISLTNILSKLQRLKNITVAKGILIFSSSVFKRGSIQLSRFIIFVGLLDKIPIQMSYLKMNSRFN